MDVRRQYSLPNCTLILMGTGQQSNSTDELPTLSSLNNAECRFVGVNTILQGGRAFFENLVKAVSAYAQECLSGVHHPQNISHQQDQIHLTKGDNNLHRLIWQPGSDNKREPVEIHLTTIQLFDLVEAVDQFFADSQTLPDLSLKLQPVPRRYRQPDEPLGQRLVPFGLGVSGLALAALICYFLPIPEVRQPSSDDPVIPTETLPNPNTSPLPGTNSTPPNSGQE
ncbi:conserved hypothetical protein [Gloeothece citriformis PCC 7424]|uniref:DUF4335 domain-containing protein n=1 Tax=Gloeothece citriformis (strain PCC 7424) TaxID=65393 RepID=B7KKR0_GLOC7|nr:DUF4335 domain-containing protein [Gloeothece citriformis]ACK71029.1 conserved hypothetical protein [Gloeothece citriformis PCC 7424]